MANDQGWSDAGMADREPGRNWPLWGHCRDPCPPPRMHSAPAVPRCLRLVTTAIGWAISGVAVCLGGFYRRLPRPRLGPCRASPAPEGLQFRRQRRVRLLPTALLGVEICQWRRRSASPAAYVTTRGAAVLIVLGGAGTIITMAGPLKALLLLTAAPLGRRPCVDGALRRLREGGGRGFESLSAHKVRGHSHPSCPAHLSR